VPAIERIVGGERVSRHISPRRPAPDKQLRLAEGGRCKPVFEALGGAVSYEAIRVVMAHRETGEGMSSS